MLFKKDGQHAAEKGVASGEDFRVALAHYCPKIYTVFPPGKFSRFCLSVIFNCYKV